MSVSEWLKTLEDFQGMCAYCRVSRYQEQDHFIPRHKGGKDDVTNYLPACIKCNKRKSDLTGKALSAVFGEATIKRLQTYLEMRFQQTVAFSEEPKKHKEELYVCTFGKRVARKDTMALKYERIRLPNSFLLLLGGLSKLALRRSALSRRAEPAN